MEGPDPLLDEPFNAGCHPRGIKWVHCDALWWKAADVVETKLCHLVCTSSTCNTSFQGCCVTHCPNILRAESGIGLDDFGVRGEVVGEGDHRMERCVLRSIGGM
ncbi:hypothetical protein E2C01_051436 [Portunus trituberculatus]|uniref:Uncharacterized protein n=1 Tax=Portunus trituberculatus TaxID=210409 RepID=A0A5B7GIQ2_PORTR|nr:hypothetical protein [Portunus trituberculatus]